MENQPAVIPGTLRRIDPRSQFITIQQVSPLVAAPRTLIHDGKRPSIHITIVCAFAAHTSLSLAPLAFLNQRIHLVSDAASRTDNGRLVWFRTQMHDSVKNPKSSIVVNRLAFRGAFFFARKADLFRTTCHLRICVYVS